MKRQAAFCLVSALTLLLGTSGCNPESGSPSGQPGTTAPRKLRIAVIPKGESHEFWKSVRAGALAEGKDLSTKDLEVEVTFKGPSEENNISDQISIVDNFLAEKYDGICLAPCDAVALRGPVNRAVEKKVPVVIFDSGLADLDGTVSFVATDNYRGGARAAKCLAKVMGEKGNVILIRYMRGSASTEEREKGFLDTIKTFGNIKMLVDNKEAGASESGAKKLSEDLLLDNKDKVDGIFCSNQSTTSGMLTALIQSFPEVLKRVKFVGFDSGTNIADALEKGQMQGTILQDPVKMGRLAVATMVKHLQGQKVEKRIAVPEEEARPDNLQTDNIRKLLRPEQSK